MAKQIKPLKVAGIYKASKLSYMVKPTVMKQFMSLNLQSNNVQTLKEAPITDKIYTYDGKNYARPQFELLPNDTKEGGIPGQKGFQFTKDNDGILHLNVVLKAFHPQANVRPLDFRTIALDLSFDKNGTTEVLSLEVKQTLPIQKLNELKHVYAHAVIKEEDKGAIYEALVTPSATSKLKVKADIWWQKEVIKSPKPDPPKPRIHQSPRPQPSKVKDICTSFDLNKLIIVKNMIMISRTNKKGIFALVGAKPFMKFANNADAKKALKVIKHYKLNRRCSVGNKFSYFLSGDNPPVGKLNGEDAITFNPSKLQVKFIAKRWKILSDNHILYDFGIDKNSAQNALKVIKKHGFDTTCYIGRPHPEMVYLKRSKPIRLQMFHRVMDRKIIDIVKARPQREIKATQVPEVSKPQKVTITSEHILLYDREDASIFQGFFDELESKEYKWQQEEKIEQGEITHSYYYRLTNDPKKVFFLPQVYRIGVNEKNGDPKIYLNLYQRESDNETKEFRINMTMHLEPYFHPSAKKDLMVDLAEISKGNIKYVDNLVLGGYQKVSFEAEQQFLSENALLSEKITESLTDINPSGFTITADHSLESFELFKSQLLTNGVNIGRIFFELEEETEEGLIVKKSRPINVELNFEKLKNIPISVEKNNDDNQLGNIPSGFCLKNNSEAEVHIKDVELTMLSTDGNFIYDADYDLGTNGIDWPIILEAGSMQNVAINQDDIDELSVENMVWNSLVCEPYGIRTNLDPDVIMASIIDRATGDSQMWYLNILCPVYEGWDDLNDEERGLYKKTFGILIEIRREEGDVIGSFELNMSNPRHRIEMSSTVQQMLQNKNNDNRKYDYRQTNITIQGQEKGDWLSSDNMAVEHLYISPPKV